MSTIKKFTYGGGMIFPPLLNFASSAGVIDINYAILKLDHAANRKKIAVIFECPVSSAYTIGEQNPFSGTLDTFECELNAVVDPATTVKFSFQDLDGNGLPDGVADQYRIRTMSDFGTTWIAPGLLTSDGTDNGTLRQVTRGQKLACVIEFVSSTGTDTVGLGVIPISLDDAWHQAKFAYHDGANWIDLYSEMKWGIACMGIKYSGIPFNEDYNSIMNSSTNKWFNMPEMIPVHSIGTSALTPFNNASSPDEVGMQFSFPADVVISGVLLYLNAVADTDVDVVLYTRPDADVYVIETVSIKVLVNPFDGGVYRYYLAKFTQDHKILQNDVHRIMVKPTSTTDVTMAFMTFDDAQKPEDLYNLTDLVNNDFIWAIDYRTDGGTFQNIPGDNTTLPFISFLMSGFQQEGSGAAMGWLGDL